MKKNIILTSANLEQSPNQKGIISFENINNETNITLKTFNLSKISGKLMLGVQQNNNFYKVEVNNFKNTNNFKINAPINLNDKLSCVLIEILNETANPILWGSNETSKVWQNSFLFNLNENQEKTESLNVGNKTSEDYNISDKFSNKLSDDYQLSEEKQVLSEKKNEDYETDDEIENIIDATFERLSANEETNEEKLTENEDFFSTIKNQVDELLNNYEQEQALESIIPNSKFVKVDYEQNGDYYIFGVIYEDDKIKYVVYGLPGEYGVKPEDDYAEFYQWLPLNADNPEGFGYYLMYQDAQNGEAIRIEII